MPEVNTRGRPIFMTLVHGTFASSARWTAANSSLCLGLTRRIPAKIQFDAFRWSGRNTFRARMQAKAELAESLEVSLHGYRNVFCLAHSHGGSILAYALKSWPELSSKLAGCVFLSTPFYIYRLQPSWRAIIDGLLFPLVLIGSLFVKELVNFLTKAFVVPVIASLGSDWYHLIFASAIVVFACGIAIVMSILRFNRWKRGVTCGILRRTRRLQRVLSSSIPSGTRSLFIRTSGDEAAALLSFMQGVSWIVSLINYSMARILRPFSRALSATKLQYPVQVFLVILALSITHASCVVYLHSITPPPPPSGIWDAAQNQYNFIYYLSRYGWSLGRYMDAMIASYLQIVLLGLDIVFIFVLLVFGGALILFLVNWIVAFMFGRVPLLAGGLLQIAVEVTPPGRWDVVHSNWATTKSHGQKLFWRHSHAYNDAKIIEIVADWMANNWIADD